MAKLQKMKSKIEYTTFFVIVQQQTCCRHNELQRGAGPNIGRCIKLQYGRKNNNINTNVTKCYTNAVQNITVIQIYKCNTNI